MKENKIIIITMVINFVVAIMKLVSGIAFSFSTLIADSVQSFIDFITDITSLFANKIGKRRANKTYPFGYGQVYYIANLFTGFLLFLIGIFILYQFFFFNGDFKPNLRLFVVLGIVLLLKGIVVALLRIFGGKYKSELMIESSKESFADFVSTCVVMGISFIVLFEAYIPEWINVDKLGSLGMAIYVFIISVKMMIANITGMLASTEENAEVKALVEHEVSKFERLEFKDVKIIKMSAYYSIFLTVKADEELTIKEFIEIERKIKVHLRSKNKMIRFLDIDLSQK